MNFKELGIQVIALNNLIGVPSTLKLLYDKNLLPKEERIDDHLLKLIKKMVKYFPAHNELIEFFPHIFYPPATQIGSYYFITSDGTKRLTSAKFLGYKYAKVILTK